MVLAGFHCPGWSGAYRQRDLGSCSLEEKKIKGCVIAAHSYFRESHKDRGAEFCIAVADDTESCKGHQSRLGKFRWT